MIPRSSRCALLVKGVERSVMRRATLQVRGVALLLAAGLFVAQPVVVGIHHLLQPHFWCPEHSTFEHWLGEAEDHGRCIPSDALRSSSLANELSLRHIACPVSHQAPSHTPFADNVCDHYERPCVDEASPEAVTTTPSVPLLSYAPKLPPPASTIA